MIIDRAQTINAEGQLNKIILSSIKTAMSITIRGIAKEGFYNINTLTWTTEPERSDDGSMPDLENDNISTFLVSRCKSNLKYYNIQDYINLMEFLCINKQFWCEYFDLNCGLYVKRKMYCEPHEMRKLRNAQYDVEGMYDCNFSFIGTRNDIHDAQTITFDANGGTGTVPNAITGVLFDIINMPALTFTKDGKTSNGYNSRADGTGRHYNLGQTTMIYGTYTLYADFGRAN